MRNIYMTWQMVCIAAFSCASSGIGVVILTLAICVWNNCRPASGQDALARAHRSETSQR
jgi:hypothetical protein